MLASSVPVTEVNSTALLPGRICGHAWVNSPCACSVAGVGAPPVAGMRDSGPQPVDAMMLPSSPQLPPNPRELVLPHSSVAAPLCAEIFFNFVEVKKAIHCPSGEKNGAIASCVPGSSVALA